MNIKRSLIITALVMAVFTVTGHAQRKTTKKTTPKTSTSAAATAAANVEVRQNKLKVASQVNTVAEFVYRLGGIATGLEDIDKGALKTPLQEPTRSTHARNKQMVVQTIRNLRAGMIALETEFQTKPNLRRFQYQIVGIGNLSAEAESLAARGQFTESGKVLLEVIHKLSETLVAMP
jgi:hypothetical protein